MDPDETFKQLVEALKDGDRATAAELAETLADWIRSGGFVPEVLDRL